MELILINYSMNPNSMVFGHQPALVDKLSEHFDAIYVVTAERRASQNSDKIRILSTNWEVGQTWANAIRFLKIAVPLIFKMRRRAIVFSHMTEVQSFLIAPLCWLLRVKHVLWYAHRSRSKFLLGSLPFLTAIVTSTPGSCPIKGKKVKYLGQGVDYLQYSDDVPNPLFPAFRWYHVGRIDPSKNIHVLIETLEKFREKFPQITLDLFGDSSSSRTSWYLKFINSLIASNGRQEWITLHGRVPNVQIPTLSRKFDAFIHAFAGSLDKTLIEASICKRFVVTTNKEYLREFPWADYSKNNSPELADHLSEFFKSKNHFEILNLSFQHAKDNHGLDHQIVGLVEVLKC